MQTDTHNRRRGRRARPAVEAMERRLALSAAPGSIKQVAAEVVIQAKKLPDAPAWADGPVEEYPPDPCIKQAPVGLTLAGKKADPTDAVTALCGSHRPPPDSSPAVASYGGLEKKEPTGAAQVVDIKHIAASAAVLGKKMDPSPLFPPEPI
jgi:hypothetical protein